MDILEQQVADAGEQGGVTLSGALALLAQREKYLALEETAHRYDVGARYGLLIAQLALVLSGQDRDEVLTRILELLARRELSPQRESTGR
jgi:UTP--glucose-1-phosphate uridylyltransferase